MGLPQQAHRRRSPTVVQHAAGVSVVMAFRCGNCEPTRRSAPAACGIGWRTAAATAMRCQMSSSSFCRRGVASSDAPIRAAATLSGRSRWRALATGQRPGCFGWNRRACGCPLGAGREASPPFRSEGLSPCTPFPAVSGPLAFNRFGIAGPGLRLQRQCGTRTEWIGRRPGAGLPMLRGRYPRLVGSRSGD